MNKSIKIIRILLAVIIFVSMGFVVNKYINGYWTEQTSLSGNGTKTNPYQITCVEDLIWLRDSVNSGTRYDSVYFIQTCDLDLNNMIWTPIGICGSDKYFYGIYDGNGNSIYNLNIPSDSNEKYPGLFGQLGGQVINLGIESGHIEGEFAGSIASHCLGQKAAIINCYNKASVIGTKRGGGICDNFATGSVINCANLGEVTAPIMGNIVSYNAKEIVNVFPKENIYSEKFSGSFIQLNEEKTYNSFYDYLNEGILNINEYNMFDYGYLKIWNR